MARVHGGWRSGARRLKGHPSTKRLGLAVKTRVDRCAECGGEIVGLRPMRAPLCKSCQLARAAALGNGGLARS